MGWLIAIVAVLGLLALMIRFPAFGLTVLSIVVLGVLYVFVQSEKSERDRKRARLEAASPERRAALKIETATLQLSSYTATVKGIAANVGSTDPIHSFDFRLQIYDCASHEPRPSDCAIVAEVSDSTTKLDIPLGQKRAFQEYVSLPTLPPFPRGWSWNMEVEAVKRDY